ncbi:hypothetical protein BO71DRAFT_238148 [Aspergillus ellipticus CBS 707.79]|uniref:Uncharacterized protein n=1 Tax=Aspergillus ellipticus CBS 707.79 TaxID=1448320 RepID=A0A319F350_9EURO|nr:hypothetical protein BO71DRAFT_238148 [Aspergillus ellipticus CBS 707.79]
MGDPSTTAHPRRPRPIPAAPSRASRRAGGQRKNHAPLAWLVYASYYVVYYMWYTSGGRVVLGINNQQSTSIMDAPRLIHPIVGVAERLIRAASRLPSSGPHQPQAHLLTNLPPIINRRAAESWPPILISEGPPSMVPRQSPPPTHFFFPTIGTLMLRASGCFSPAPSHLHAIYNPRTPPLFVCPCSSVGVGITLACVYCGRLS